VADQHVPASIALAWGLQPQPARGPKRSLSIERIVAAGMVIAVADGIGAVSMGRVAAELGASTMALYRYLPGKDDLLELMVDTALGAPPAAEPGESWRDGMHRWAVGVRDSYRAHPWALRVPISAPPLGPNNIRWLENALAALAPTPLDAQQKLSCVLLVSGFVRAEETLLLDMAAASAEGVDAQYAGVLRQLVDAHRFPNVVAAIESGAVEDEDGIDQEFDFGIERILDGIETLVVAERKRRRAVRRGRPPARAPLARE
jgi:AcrR family transcriptional regulator